MIASRQSRPNTFIEGPALVLISLWVLTMIALPIVNWLVGPAALQRGIMVGVLVQVTTVVTILGRAWGWRRALLTSSLVVVVAWAAEAVGSATGVPFGHYQYTEVLQPQLAQVPLLIPLAWLMMLPPAWAVASLIVGDPQRHRVAFVAASALAFTAWDLFLDPQMVLWRFWTWQQAGAYFGIPWINFLGWFLVSALATTLARPSNLPVGTLVAVYGITWALQFVGQLLFWDLPGPALVGFLAMGSMLAWGLARGYKRVQLKSSVAKN